MSGGAGQARDGGDRCLLRVNASFGTDLVACAGLRALLRRPGARIGTFEDLRLRTTSTRLVVETGTGGAVIAEACPACGARLAG